MALPFRQRIFLILVALTAVPTALAVLGCAVAVRTVGPSAGARVGWEEVAASARDMVDRIDTRRLAPRERAAVRRLLEQVSTEVTLSRSAETYLRYYTGAFAGVVVVLGAVVVFAGVRVAGHLSRQLSRPIDELVGWTRLIRRPMPLPAGPPTHGAPQFQPLRQALRQLATALHQTRAKKLKAEPLPAGPPTHGAPEFEALRQALRELATALDQARDKELEAERLRAFREVARRVAHEIKNPLTAMRIGVDRLRRSGCQADRRTETAVEVLASETDRLERPAQGVARVRRAAAGPQGGNELVGLPGGPGQKRLAPPGARNGPGER